jgi:hypothetical protein
LLPIPLAFRLMIRSGRTSGKDLHRSVGLVLHAWLSPGPDSAAIPHQIGEDQRLALVEYVAHLTAKDYNATLVDLVRLGFIPPEVAENEAKRNIVAPILGQVRRRIDTTSWRLPASHNTWFFF